MKKRFTFLTAFIFGITGLVFTQPALPEFGNFTVQEMNMTECTFEKDAGAVILFDYGNAGPDDRYNLITDRRIRIKILNEKGLDAATVKIPFYSRDNFELISGIEALSYTPVEGSNWKTTYLEKKSIFTEKVNDFYSVVKFAIPNVKAGSIIEYMYKSEMKSFAGLDMWSFQNEIPTMRSCYFLKIPENAEFQYRVEKKRTYPVTINNKPGTIYFEMTNIPGLVDEPYMDALKDYLQRVEFQFSGYSTLQGNRISVMSTWKELAQELVSEKSYGGALKKELPKDETLRTMVAAEETEEGKLKTIYNFVRNNFSWNGRNTKYAPDGLKKAWDSRSGSAAEINMILVRLLLSNKIEAYPLLVAERDFGKVDTSYPFIDRFNKTAVYAKAGGKTFILDATDPSVPPGLVPYPLLNTYAFAVDKKNFMLFRIRSAALSFNFRADVQAQLNADGILTGNAELTCTDYARQLLSAAIRKDEKKYIQNYILADNKDIGVDSFQCENLQSENEPLKQRLKFVQDMNESGGYILLNYNLFTGLQKTPFTRPERFTNVDFGFPVIKNVELKISLPPGSSTDKLPAFKKVESARKDISCTRDISLKDNILNIRISFNQTVTVIPAEGYENLRKTYRDIVEMLNEPVTIKVQ
jgi:hypothetical protein